MGGFLECLSCACADRRRMRAKLPSGVRIRRSLRALLRPRPERCAGPFEAGLLEGMATRLHVRRASRPRRLRVGQACRSFSGRSTAGPDGRRRRAAPGRACGGCACADQRIRAASDHCQCCGHRGFGRRFVHRQLASYPRRRLCRRVCKRLDDVPYRMQGSGLRSMRPGLSGLHAGVLRGQEVRDTMIAQRRAAAFRMVVGRHPRLLPAGPGSPAQPLGLSRRVRRVRLGVLRGRARDHSERPACNLK